MCLLVMSKLDMDGRIRCGLVGRLRVPPGLKSQLEQQLGALTLQVADARKVKVYVALGRRGPLNKIPIYTISYALSHGTFRVINWGNSWSSQDAYPYEDAYFTSHCRSVWYEE